MCAEWVLAIVAGMLYACAAVLALVRMRCPPPGGERILMRLVTLAAGALLAALILYGRHTGGFPVFGRFEASAWYATAITAAYLYAAHRYDTLRTVSAILFLYVTAIVFLGLPGLGSVSPPDPRLRSPLLALHVLMAFSGYGLFTLESALGAAYLVQDHQLKSKRFGPLSRHLPSLEVLDRAMAELIGTAFTLFTVSIGLGICLAQMKGWGFRWVTDPKISMTGATWLVYAILFHLQRRADRHGRLIAYVAVLGFACIVAAFLGLHLVTDSLHSFGFQVPPTE